MAEVLLSREAQREYGLLPGPARRAVDVALRTLGPARGGPDAGTWFRLSVGDRWLLVRQLTDDERMVRAPSSSEAYLVARIIRGRDDIVYAASCLEQVEELIRQSWGHGQWS